MFNPISFQALKPQGFKKNENNNHQIFLRLAETEENEYGYIYFFCQEI